MCSVFWWVQMLFSPEISPFTPGYGPILSGDLAIAHISVHTLAHIWRIFWIFGTFPVCCQIVLGPKSSSPASAAICQPAFFFLKSRVPPRAVNYDLALLAVRAFRVCKGTQIFWVVWKKEDCSRAPLCRAFAEQLRLRPSPLPLPAPLAVGLLPDGSASAAKSVSSSPWPKYYEPWFTYMKLVWCMHWFPTSRAFCRMHRPSMVLNRQAVF